MFQRPCRIILLPSYFSPPPVVNSYDRSIFNMTGSLGFWYRGTSECTLVPAFWNWEHSPKPPFWKLPFGEPLTQVLAPFQSRKKPQKIAA